ncbi:MAG: DUF4835 family protein [Saprospiraceae bacterium]|jgi:hypothetical protein|nr:DUF4835 family protein [Saprospiraceae bacterium]
MRFLHFPLFLLLSFLSFKTLSAQEIVFEVIITKPTTQLVDPKVYKTMENAVIELINTRRWTENEYLPEERIKCNIQINITKEQSETNFDAELTIQATRPVYGSNYETILLNHVDRDFNFSFEEARPLIYSENQFTDNLSHVLAFYVYLVLGLDNDSFSPFGGDAMFQKAQEIINVVPGSSPPRGWRANDGNRNRYWLAENIQSPRVRAFRKSYYDYHRLGLDVMHKDAIAGRTAISAALDEIEKVNVNYPSAPILIAFVNAKSQELADIFIQATSAEKLKVYRVLTKIDPSAAARIPELKR